MWWLGRSEGCGAEGWRGVGGMKCAVRTVWNGASLEDEDVYGFEALQFRRGVEISQATPFEAHVYHR